MVPPPLLLRRNDVITCGTGTPFNAAPDHFPLYPILSRLLICIGVFLLSPLDALALASSLLVNFETLCYYWGKPYIPILLSFFVWTLIHMTDRRLCAHASHSDMLAFIIFFCMHIDTSPPYFFPLLLDTPLGSIQSVVIQDSINPPLLSLAFL